MPSADNGGISEPAEQLWVENSGRSTIAVAKVLFNWAVDADRKYVDVNPFAGQSSQLIENEARTFFVERHLIGAILETISRPQWRLLIALGRYGGLRIPSEPLALT